MTYWFSQLLIGIGTILDYVLWFYTLIIIGAVILSWVRPDPYQSPPIVLSIARVLNQLTEPVFYFVRRKLPASFFRSGIDFSPLIVIFGLILIQFIIINPLIYYGHKLEFKARLNDQLPAQEMRFRD